MYMEITMPEPASIALFGTGCFGLVVRYLRRQYRTFKPYFDWCVGLVLLVLSMPLIAVLALLVKLTSRGPAFYRQERVGLNGRTFRLLKLRTCARTPRARPGRSGRRIRRTLA